MTTRQEMLDCVDREIRLRERVYPRWVALGRLSLAKSRDEIATMKAVREALGRLLPREPEVQRDLFGGPQS
jgi:hypothetical protein